MVSPMNHMFMTGRFNVKVDFIVGSVGVALIHDLADPDCFLSCAITIKDGVL